MFLGLLSYWEGGASGGTPTPTPTPAVAFAPGGKRSWGGEDPVSKHIFGMDPEDEVRRILDHYDEIAKAREPKAPPKAKRKALAEIARPEPTPAPVQRVAIVHRPVKVTFTPLRDHDTAPAVEAARRKRRNAKIRQLIVQLVANDEI